MADLAEPRATGERQVKHRLASPGGAGKGELQVARKPRYRSV